MIKFNSDDQIEEKNIPQILEKLSKERFANQIKANALGAEIYDDLKSKGSCSIKRLLNWLYFTENLLKLISNVLKFYQDIVIAEFYDNNFKLKIKNPTDTSGKNTIGFLFGLFEDNVRAFLI